MGREPWTSRLTVEECPIYVSTADLLRDGALGPDVPQRTLWVSWPLSDGTLLGKLMIETGAEWRGKSAIFVFRQVFNVGGKQVMGAGQTIRITTTRPHFGGERFWFICGCGRQSGELYIPDGETVFRCRLCYDLTYQSSQEHNTDTAKTRALLETIWSAHGNLRRKSVQSRHSRKLRKVSSAAT
jgi:hypothetical protein